MLPNVVDPYILTGLSVDILVAQQPRVEINWNRLAAHVQEVNPTLQSWMHTYSGIIVPKQAIGKIAEEVSRQASMIAFVDAYWIVAVVLILMLPLVLLLKPINYN